MVAEYYDKVGRIDELLKEGAHEGVSDELGRLLEDRDVRIYFFDNADSPEWLSILRNSGWLIEGLKTGEWPAYPYLERVASDVPEEISPIAERVSKARSIGIRRKVLNLARQLPLSESWEVTARVTGWVEDDAAVQWLAEPAREYCCELAQSSRPSVALPVLEGLLRLGVKDKEDASFWSYPQAKLREWQYQETVEEAGWALFKAAPGETWESLVVAVAEGLNRVVEAYEQRRESGWKPDFPRSAIEEHSQNSPKGALDYLIAAVRDMSEEMLLKESASLSEIVTELESYEWAILDRVALHLVRKYAEPGSRESRRHIVNERLFSSYRHHHEYYLLVHDHYPGLDAEDQERLLGWIEDEVDREAVIEEIGGNRAEAEQEADERIELRHLNRLSALVGELPDDWDRYYQELVEEYGQPQHPEFLSYTTTDVWVEESSELDAAWFSDAEVEEIAELSLRAAEGDEISPSTIGTHLSAAVAEEPGRFSRGAGMFQEVAPTVVRGILRGFRDASSDGMDYSWRGVLDLCEHVLAQEYSYDRQRSAGLEEEWANARRAVADLLATALEKEAGSPSHELREEVWSVLEKLVDDLDPPQDESLPSMEPATQALNTTRGQALHAVFRYCWWVKRELDDDGYNLDRVPEALEVLEGHVSPTRDPSLAIRAVYGQWFPSIAGLDRSWAEEHVSDVFPSGSDFRRQWQAAFRTYLVFWYPNKSIYPLLQQQYDRSVEQLTGDKEDLSGGAPLRDPEVRLGEHLLAVYSWGIVDSDDAALLYRYMSEASLEARTNLIQTVGTQLSNADNGIDEEILQRLQVFWEDRVNRAEEGETTARDEVGAFVAWYSADVFDRAWAATQLIRSLKAASQLPDYPMNSIDVLADSSDVEAGLRLRCLELLLSGSYGDTLARTNQASVRSIFEDALSSHSHDVRERASELIDNLGRQGVHELRDLLEG